MTSISTATVGATPTSSGVDSGSSTESTGGARARKTAAAAAVWVAGGLLLGI